MRKIARRALTASAVAATAVALAAMPASALPITFNVQNGGNITGTNSGSIVGFGNINGSTLECTSSTATGSLPTGTGVPGTGIATLSGVSFSSPGQVNNWCVANGSIPTQVTATGLPWSFDATGAGTGSGPGGTTDGRLNNVKVTLHSPSVPCDATVGGPGSGGSGGYIEGTYTNPSTLTGHDATLEVPFGGANNLTVLSVSSATNCAGLISVGETVTLAGTYTVVNASGVSPSID